MSYNIDRKEFDEAVERKDWEFIWSAVEYAIEAAKPPVCICCVIEGRRYTCENCTAKLDAECSSLKEKVRSTSELCEKALAQISRLQNSLAVLTGGVCDNKVGP